MKIRNLILCTFMALTAFSLNVNALEVKTEEELTNCAKETSATCTLGADIEMTKNLLIPAGSTIILELNGKTLDITNLENNYGVTIKGDLTINGEGTVNVGKYGIGTSTAGGNLTINSGTYNTNGDYLIGAFGGQTIINGGTFNSNYCVANAFVEYTGLITINGGKFNTVEDYTVLGNTTVKGGEFNHDVSDYVTQTDSTIKTKTVDGIMYVGVESAITIIETSNGKVEANETAIAGEPVTLQITPSIGYEVKSIKVVDANEKEVKVTDNKFIMPNSEVTVTVLFEEIVYDVVGGEKQEITYKEGKDVTFKIDAPFELFDKLFINGKEVPKKYYTVKEGSTIITLKNEYVKQLESEDTYKVKVTFTNGGYATGEFMFSLAVTNPDTSDNIGIYFAIFAISVGTLVYFKRRNNMLSFN